MGVPRTPLRLALGELQKQGLLERVSKRGFCVRGDTGITADQDLVVRGHYNAKLAAMNIADGFTTGPVEAAYVINELVKPASELASHANEVATVDGKVRAGSKTEAFIKASKVPVLIPLSGKTLEFDAAGQSPANC